MVMENMSRAITLDSVGRTGSGKAVGARATNVQKVITTKGKFYGLRLFSEFVAYVIMVYSIFTSYLSSSCTHLLNYSLQHPCLEHKEWIKQYQEVIRPLRIFDKYCAIHTYWYYFT